MSKNVVSEPLKKEISKPMVEEISAKAEKPTEETIKPTVKRKKLTLSSHRQKLQAIYARIKYREQTVKSLRGHLKKGTFPKRFKSLRLYPKMDTPESQAIVNADCEQVNCVILEQLTLEEEKKLIMEQACYQAMKEKRAMEEQEQKENQSRADGKPKMLTVEDVMQELADLRSKYTELCSKLDSKE